MSACCCSGNDTIGGIAPDAPTAYDKTKQEMVGSTKADAVFLQVEDSPGPLPMPRSSGLGSHEYDFMKKSNAAIIEVCEDDNDMPEWTEPPQPEKKTEEPPAVVVIPNNEEPKVDEKQEADEERRLTEPASTEMPGSVQPAETGCELNKTRNTMQIRFLRACGEFIGFHPCKVACLNLVVMLICLPLGFRKAEAFGGDGFSPNKPFRYLWTEKGGDLEDELDMVDRYTKKEWQIDDYHIMMAYGRGDNAGKNAVSPEAFAELLPVLELWHSISVTTSKGHTYSSYDICRRGIVPDFPQAWTLGAGLCSKKGTCNPAIQLPCIVVTPILCFSEMAETLHPSYRYGIDANLPGPGLPDWKSFVKRPSFKTMNSSAILEEIGALRPDGLRGCQLFTGGTVGPTAFLGEIKPTWTSHSTYLDAAAGVRNLFYYDPPGTIAFRLNFTQPHLVNHAEIQEAIDLHGKKFSAEVFKMSENNMNGAFFEFTNLRPGALEAAADEGRKLPMGLLLLGVFFLYSYFFLATVDFTNPLRSRTLLATNGFFVIVLALVTSMSLYFALGGTLNVAVIIGVPLLQLGLAADDMFVILAYFNDLGEDFIKNNDQHIVLGELWLRCAIGVIVTSMCNFISFMCGTFIPLRGLADFCLGVSICALVNLFFVLTEFMPAMCLEIQRIKNGGPEWHPLVYFCHKRALKRPSSNKTNCKSRITVFLKDVYAPFLLKLPVMVTLSVLSMSFLALMAWNTTTKDIGWNPGSVAADGTEANKALPMLFEHFQMFPISLIFKPGLDVVANQQAMIELYQKLSTTKHTTWGTSPPYLTVFYLYLAGMSQTPLASNPNMTYGDIGFKTDLSGWKDPLWAKYGLGPKDPKVFYQAYHTLAKPPFLSPSWTGTPAEVGQAAQGGAYINFDSVGNQKFTFGPKPMEAFEFSWFGFQGIDLYTDQDIVDCIDETMDIVEKSPLKDYAFINSLTFSYWRAFMALETKMFMLLITCVVAIGLFMMVILCSIRAAIVGIFCSAMIVFELYGVCMFFLKFNPFVVATLLSASGLSVEFTSHTIAAFFIEESGSIKSRLGQAMKQTFLPVVHGSISTGLTVLPLLFAPVEFITMYQCYPVYFLIGIGFVNSFVFLPAMLGLCNCGCLQ